MRNKRIVRTHSMIRKVICNYFNLNYNDIDINTRKREICEPRQIEHTMMKVYTKASLSEIGVLGGEKDHASVLHSKKTINNLLDTDKDFVIKYRIIQDMFNDEKFNQVKNVFMNIKNHMDKKNYLIKHYKENERIREESNYVDQELLSIIGN